MTHGTTTTAYTRGCRCQPCRAAGTLQYKRWQVAAARNGGHLTAPAAPTRTHINDLRAHGWNYRQISLHCGLEENGAHRIATRAHRVTLRTAQAIADLWNDHCAPLEPDRRTWPTAPLRQAIERQYGSLKASGQPHIARAINRHPHLTTNRAETYTDQLGWLAVDVWPDWYQQAEKGAA